MKTKSEEKKNIIQEMTKQNRKKINIPEFLRDVFENDKRYVHSEMTPLARWKFIWKSLRGNALFDNGSWMFHVCIGISESRKFYLRGTW